MYLTHLILCLFTLHASRSDWVSEWMSPVQEQLHLNEFRKSNNRADLKNYVDDPRMMQLPRDSPEIMLSQKAIEPTPNNYMSTGSLKLKLEDTLHNAKALTEALKMKILDLVARENTLKEAIFEGRFGVSTVTVSTLTHMPRSYIIRDKRWTLCNGMIQFPAVGNPTNLFDVLFTEPRCIGKEVIAKQDPCVFNSVIKYETVPSRRALEYSEDDYLCLKPAFHKTLERYMSVTKRLMNETCGDDGAIRSLAENNLECGIRTLTEYTFYPHKSSAAATLPLEYCTEKDGSCKLIVAWHVSNTTIENFEFLKNEHNFKKYFIKSGPYIEHIN